MLFCCVYASGTAIPSPPPRLLVLGGRRRSTLWRHLLPYRARLALLVNSFVFFFFTFSSYSWDNSLLFIQLALAVLSYSGLTDSNFHVSLVWSTLVLFQILQNALYPILLLLLHLRGDAFGCPLDIRYASSHESDICAHLLILS